MKREVILVLDVGTSSTKTTAVDVKTGELIGLETQTYPMVLPQEGYMELDPEAVWSAAQKALGDLLKKISDSCHFNAISFSWFADDLVLCDENFQPTTNIMLFFDARAGETYDYFVKKNPAETCKKAVRGFSVNCEPMKTLWVKRNEPEVFAKSRYMFDNQQYILAKLGLEPVNDDSMAVFKCVEDVYERRWAKDILDLYEIPEEMCSQRIVSCCEPLGKIRKFGEVELPEEIEVFPGMHDELCAVLGLGVLPENGACISDMMGTSNTINFLVDYTDRKEKPTEGTLPIRTGFATYNAFGRGFPVLGGSLEWYVRTFCAGQNKSGIFDRLFDAVEFNGKNSVMMVPWFGKHKVGMKGMSSITTASDIFAALIEGLCYECSYSMQYNDDLMMKHRGQHLELVRAGGGGSQSDKWLQLRASLYNLPVQRTITPQVGAVGAAIMAATGLGMYADFKEASKKMVALGRIFEPDPAQREAYMKKEPMFKAFHDYIMG